MPIASATTALADPETSLTRGFFLHAGTVRRRLQLRVWRLDRLRDRKADAGSADRVLAVANLVPARAPVSAV